MKPIAIFYHCLFYTNGELNPHAMEVVDEQMHALRHSGLLDAASLFIAGINGGKESDAIANLVLPPKAVRLLHGQESHSENATIVALEEWLRQPEHGGWLVLYFHSKGATHQPGPYKTHGMQWRRCMMRHLVWQWRLCVNDLNRFESVGCHWLSKFGSDKSQNYWAGNFWWARSSFLQTLPSIRERARIKMSGLLALESRYEAEVWIGNGRRLPICKDYHPVNPSIFNACVLQI